MNLSIVNKIFSFENADLVKFTIWTAPLQRQLCLTSERQAQMLIGGLVAHRPWGVRVRSPAASGRVHIRLPGSQPFANGGSQGFQA